MSKRCGPTNPNRPKCRPGPFSIQNWAVQTGKPNFKLKNGEPLHHVMASCSLRSFPGVPSRQYVQIRQVGYNIPALEARETNPADTHVDIALATGFEDTQQVTPPFSSSNSIRAASCELDNTIDMSPANQESTADDAGTQNFRKVIGPDGPIVKELPKIPAKPPVSTFRRLDSQALVNNSLWERALSFFRRTIQRARNYLAARYNYVVHDKTIISASVEGEMKFTWDVYERAKSGDAIHNNHPFFVGQIIDGWSITEIIGQGGLGVIYGVVKSEIIDGGLSLKEGVLKAPLIQMGRDANVKSQGMMLQGLTSPNTVRVHQVGSSRTGLGDATDYYVMDRIKGPTLKSLLRDRGSLSEPEVEILARCLCSALEVAYEKGQLWQDVKPDNIMVVTDERGNLISAVLLDPIPREEEDIKKGTIGGTPVYMAPEHLLGKPRRRSDLFSLGYVLYQAATGRLPHKYPSGDGGDPVVVLSYNSKEIEPPKGTPFSTHTWELIARLSHPDAEQRFNSPMEVVAALNEREIAQA